MSDLLAFLCVMVSCVFVNFWSFLYGVPDQVWYLIVSIPDRCILPYVYASTKKCSHKVNPYPIHVFNWRPFHETNNTCTYQDQMPCPGTAIDQTPQNTEPGQCLHCIPS